MSRNLILGVLVAVATFGCATTQNPNAGNARTASNSTDKSVTAAANQHCVKDTGSLIKQPDQHCANRPGTSYSQQELQDTGRIDTGEALRELDPRLQ